VNIRPTIVLSEPVDFKVVTRSQHYRHETSHRVYTKQPTKQPTMKLSAVTTICLATLAIATPAPAAQPDANAAAVAQPIEVLEARDPMPKKSKPKGGSGNNGNDTNAATTISPSLALQLGALGVGVMEVVRLW